MDIQYAQSGVFTPADFAFPTNGIKAEATPNSEAVLIADLEMDLLKKVRSHGSVHNLADRRTDMYELRQIIPAGTWDIITPDPKTGELSISMKSNGVNDFGKH
jgi:hypothetical protein